MKKSIKTCCNCHYFEKHYKKSDACFFEVENCGHCRNNISHMEVVEHLKNSSPCEYFEPFHKQKTRRKKSIEKVIRSMAERLEEIKQILKD